jgi:ribonuclease HI
MIVTNEWLRNNRTPNGGYSRKQVELLGFTWPLDKGWKEKIIGKEISEDVVNKFEAISSGVMKGQKSINAFFTQTNESDPAPVSEPASELASELSFEPTPEMVKETEFDYYVYTDGACIDNGRPSALASIGIYFGEDDKRNVSRKVTGDKYTNNIAEIQAFIYAHQIIKPDLAKGKKICICTDSTYVIKCITTYGDKCSVNLWQKDIPNKELVMMAYYLYNQYPNLKVMHVKAHTEKEDVHSKGNDSADRLANQALGLTSCPYADKKQSTRLEDQRSPASSRESAALESFQDQTVFQPPKGYNADGFRVNTYEDDEDNNKRSSSEPSLNRFFQAIDKGGEEATKTLPTNYHKRIYLNVPFHKKETIKELGGKWDADMKKWYIDQRNSSVEKALKLFKQCDVMD